MEIYLGLVGIILGAYLFMEGYLRIFKLFTLIGAAGGYYFVGLFEPILVDLLPTLAGDMRPAGFVIGGVVAYNLARMAEASIVTLGPPLAVVMSYDYLRVEKDIDMLEYVERVPEFPNISSEALQGMIFLITTFLTTVFKMYLWRIVPVLISAGISGVLLVTGANAIRTRSLPESGYDLEFAAIAIVTACSAAAQGYHIKKKEDEEIDSDPEIVRLRKQGEDVREQRRLEGEFPPIRCPRCSEEAPHEVINRKSLGDKLEVLVKCLSQNQFDEVCEHVHTVHEFMSD